MASANSAVSKDTGEAEIESRDSEQRSLPTGLPQWRRIGVSQTACQRYIVIHLHIGNYYCSLRR
jgi:hypothetical protein